MKRSLKAISLFVVLIMFISLAGCSALSTETKATTATPAATTTKNTPSTTVDPKKQITYKGKVTGTLPLTDTPVTFTYWVPLNSDTAKVMKSFAEVPAMVEMVRLTNVTIKYIHPALKEEKQNFQLLIASQQLPDIIELNGLDASLYPGGPEVAIADGAFLRLNELVDKYAPNYKALMEADPEIARGLHTDSGNLYAFQMIEEIVQPAYGGAVVRQDWMSDLKIADPVTMDDWYAMLKRFRDEKGADAPLLLEKTGGTDGYYAFIGAYNVTHTFSRRGQTVIYGPIDEGFRKYLTTMNKWYKEKLIDQDFLSHDGITGANTLKKISAGEVGAWEAGFHHFKTTEDTVRAVDPKFTMRGLPYPTAVAGQAVTIRQYNEKIRGICTFITKDCKNPELATKLLDFNYSDQGTMLMNYGVEGVHYKMENGKVVFLEAATNNPAFPNSLMVSIFARHQGPFVRDYARTWPWSYRQNALDASLLVWKGDNSGMMPKTLTMTAEEGTKYNTIMGDIETLVLEMMPKFIMGVEPMENFDKFVAKIKQMDISKAIAIKQASLDRYNKR